MASLTHLAARCVTALPGAGRLLGRTAEGAGDAAAIFMLHRVLPDPSSCYDPEMVVTLSAFEAFLAWAVERYEVVPLEDLQSRLRRRRTTARRTKPLCALTFDDGWLDTFTQAFPVLQRWQAPATVFLPLHFIGTDRRFWQERLYFHLRRLGAESDAMERLRAVAREFPWCPELEADDLNFVRLRARLVRRSSPEAEAFVERLGTAAGLSLELVGRVFMNWDEVRTMQNAGIRFGSHTLDHTLLRCAAPAAAAVELRRSRQALSAQLDAEVQAFSYPWGGLSPFTRAQAREAGYGCAVTTQPGLTRAGSDPWQLPRIALSDAQLGWRPGALKRRATPGFAPATLQIHLARARAFPPRPPAVANTDLAGEPDRIRIGCVIDNPRSWSDIPDGRLEGSELQLRCLLEALDPEFFAVELYFLQPPAGGLPTLLPWPCFAAAPAAAGRRTMVVGLRGLLRQRRPVIVQTLFQDSMFLGVVAAWMAGVPSILCARRNAGYWKRWYHRGALRVINRMANAWQTNSSSVARRLTAEEGVPARAIEILPNWLDIERFQPASPAARQAGRRALGLPADAFAVASVANYRPIKNLDCLVEAAAVVARALPKAHFLLLGEGPEQAALEAQIAALRLDRQVHLAGSSDQVEKYLAAADVGVLTSRSEGCSNAVLEYMAAGLPTVLSDIPANRALTDAGLFPVGDAATLAAALLELADDEDLRASRGRANRRRAEPYGGNAFSERVQSHYLRMAALARRRWRDRPADHRSPMTLGAPSPPLSAWGGPPAQAVTASSPDPWPAVGGGEPPPARGQQYPPHSTV